MVEDFIKMLDAVYQLAEFNGTYYSIYCKIETDKVAKKIPQFCNYEFPTIAKGH